MSSTNAVSFSSARTMKRFSSSRCAATAQFLKKRKRNISRTRSKMKHGGSKKEPWRPENRSRHSGLIYTPFIISPQNKFLRKHLSINEKLRDSTFTILYRSQDLARILVTKKANVSTAVRFFYKAQTQSCLEQSPQTVSRRCHQGTALLVRSRGAVFMSQSELRHLSSDFVTKKLPPPTPDRCEGRLFPPEQS